MRNAETSTEQNWAQPTQMCYHARHEPARHAYTREAHRFCCPASFSLSLSFTLSIGLSLSLTHTQSHSHAHRAAGFSNVLPFISMVSGFHVGWCGCSRWISHTLRGSMPGGDTARGDAMVVRAPGSRPFTVALSKYVVWSE